MPATMKRFAVLLACALALGCGSNDKAYDFKAYPFDHEVIDRLPLYDSISQVLLQNFAALQEEMKKHASFDYSFSGPASMVNPKFPAEIVEKIRAFQSRLGKTFLFELSVYKDSSIKYSVRDSTLKGSGVTVKERLSFLPNGGNMQRRQAPNKDTALNANWQYWIRFD